MRVDLTSVTFDQFIAAVFAPEAPLNDAEPWYALDVSFAVDPQRQVALMGQAFRSSSTLRSAFSFTQLESGLWLLLGGNHSDSFVDHLGNPKVPLEDRIATVDAVYELYDGLLAAPPFEAIDFCAPDRLPRRFCTIDYMTPDLLVHVCAGATSDDHGALRNALLGLFTRLLRHRAPVAQYAALHGLGHLNHEAGRDVIADYLVCDHGLPRDVAEYAERAQRGAVL